MQSQLWPLQPQPPLRGDQGQSLDSSELLLEVGSARGGNPVQYGCSLSSMSYMTFAMISIYTMINVNNVSTEIFRSILTDFGQFVTCSVWSFSTF